MTEYSRDVVIPHLEAEAARQGLNLSFIAAEDGAEIHVKYDAVVAGPREVSYMLDVVKVEFGGRNLTEPCQSHQIQPYMAAAPGMGDLQFPVAQVASWRQNARSGRSSRSPTTLSSGPR